MVEPHVLKAHIHSAWFVGGLLAGQEVLGGPGGVAKLEEVVSAWEDRLPRGEEEGWWGEEVLAWRTQVRTRMRRRTRRRLIKRAGCIMW